MKFRQLSSYGSTAWLWTVVAILTICMFGVGLASVTVHAAGVLTIKDLTGKVILLDANKPGEEGPDVLSLQAKVCNVGDQDLTDVRVYVGDYSTVGYFPVTPLLGNSYSFRLLDEYKNGDVSDGTRLLGTIPATDPDTCYMVYWQVWYPRLSPLGEDVLDNQVLYYDIWGDAAELSSPTTVAGSATYRKHITASENKIYPQGSSITVSPTGGTISIGESVSVCYLGTKLGNIQHVGADIWHQPIGDSSLWNPDILQLATITSTITSDYSACHGEVYDYIDNPYLQNIASGDWDDDGVVEACVGKPQSLDADYCYTFVAIDNGTNSLNPYQEAASGNQFKYNDDYNTQTVTITNTNSCSISLFKSADPANVLTGDTLTYEIEYQNLTANTVGFPPTVPLVISDPVPSNTTYQAGSASCPTGVSCTIYYSTDGTNWSASEPSPASAVTHLRFYLNESVPPSDIDSVSYSVTVNTDDGVHADPAVSTFDGGPECSRSGDVYTTPVTLSYFFASRGGETVRFEWSTATETGNVGFNLYVVDPGGRQRVNSDLIPSHVVDSVEPQDYVFEADGVDGDQFVIEDVDLFGRTRQHGPFFIGEVNGARVAPEPIDWSAIRAEHDAKAAVRTGKAGSTTVQGQGTSPEKNVPGRSVATESIAASGPVRLQVERDGLYRVTYEELLAAGFDLAEEKVTELALTNRGTPVPLFAQSSGPKFGPGAYIEFYGQALDTLYTDTNIYELVVDRRLAQRVAVDDTAPDLGAQPAPFYMETAMVDNNVSYAFYAPGGDPWYSTKIRAGTTPVTRAFSVDVEGLVLDAAPSTLTVDVWGATDWPDAPDHHVIVLFNNVEVADEWFDGVEGQQITGEVEAGIVQNGSNTLTLTLPGDTGVLWDHVDLDRYSVTYPRAFVAREDRLRFEAAGDLFQVTGMSSADVVVYRLDNAGLARLGEVLVDDVNGAYRATFAGTGAPATYLLATDGALLAPTMEPGRPEVDITSGPAQFLMIAHPSFEAGLAPLVASREAEGYTVRVVSVEDVYAQFSQGIIDPVAIQDYIAHAATDMETEYVLLVGGDTYDYHDYLGTGSMSFIPSLYAATDELVRFAPVDPLYADVDGDGLPDLPIGRFPVRSAAELDLLVTKTLAYGTKDYGRTAVFAADDGFAGDSWSFIGQLPDGWAVEPAHIDELGAAEARNRLLGALNGGVALTSFVGHSGPTNWTYDSLFNATDAANLANYGRPTVVTQWGCWNTYHVVPQYNTLAHKFLLSGDQGAAAVLGPTALSLDASDRAFGRLLTPKLAEPGMAIGAAIQEAKTELGALQPYLVDVLLGWTLLGDPTLVVQP